MSDIDKLLNRLKLDLSSSKTFNVKSYIETVSGITEECKNITKPNALKVMSEIMKLSEPLKKLNVDEEKKNWLPVHLLYTELCKLTFQIYRIVNDNLKTIHLRQGAKQYLSKGFWSGDQVSSNELSDHLKHAFEELPKKGQSFGDRELKRQVTQGYTVHRGKVNENQYHLEELPKRLVESLDRYMSKSSIIMNLSYALGYNLKICNVRAYRYFNSKIGDQIRAHHDGLAPGIFKIMAFKGEITHKHGAFEVIKEKTRLRRITKYFFPNDVIESCTGLNPFMVVDSNKKLHRANNPLPGYVRDTIEITLMPQLFKEDKLILVGGCQAGFPTNPFQS